MEDLLQQLVARAGEEDGLEWIKSCLARKPALAAGQVSTPVPTPCSPSRSEDSPAVASGSHVGSKRKRAQKIVYSPPVQSPSTRSRTQDVRVKPAVHRSGISRSPAQDVGGRHHSAAATSVTVSVASSRCSRKSAVGAPDISASPSASNSVSWLPDPTANPAPTSAWRAAVPDGEDEVTSPQHVPNQLRLPTSSGLSGSRPADQDRDISRRDPKTVWIIGHSFIFWAQKRASQCSYSENLSFCSSFVQVFWHSIKGMQWRDLVVELESLSFSRPPPDLIIIHLSGNDIGKIKTTDLLSIMRNDLYRLKLKFSSSCFVFSEIIPRLLWANSNLSFFDKIRKRVNRKMSILMSLLHGFSFRHIDLEGFTPGLYRSDLIHLSDIGLDIFNLDLQSMIEQWLWCFGGAMPL
ncbi:uncharacterized protein [Ranitomeya imitator]|uniref:uncharacterized protein n=1 Tax=Ranitomeya imitator TaxID=111125 RepID=UPI0037E8D5AA